MTTSPPEESKQTVATLPSDNIDAKGVVAADPSIPREPSPHKEKSPTDYPLKDYPEAPLGAEDGSVVPLANRTQCVPQMIHFLDSGQARQLIHLIKITEDLSG